mgnify:CR=1 FL=1
MKLVKNILQHNINNFRHSVSLHHELYVKGMESRTELAVGLLNCVKERFKFFHWTSSSF